MPTDGVRTAFAISGASGRMGRQAIELIGETADGEVVGAWVGPKSSHLDHCVDEDDASLTYTIVGQTRARPDVVIDFSRADAFDAVLAWCVREGVALVSGTTGLSTAQHDAIVAAGQRIAVLWSANFSPGIAVLARIVADAAKALPAWDVEISEAHHAGKRDAPSGTALALGRQVTDARAGLGPSRNVGDRHGVDLQRSAGDIGFSVVRAGDIVGEHTVMLAAAGERLELTHRATSRGVFARGAVSAARWLAGRAPGVYRFDDSLD